MLTIKILANGDLSIKAYDPKYVQDMIDQGREPDMIIADLFSDDYETYLASDFGAQFTESPRVCECMDISESGNLFPCGNIWEYMPPESLDLLNPEDLAEVLTTRIVTELAAGNKVVYNLLD